MFNTGFNNCTLVGRIRGKVDLSYTPKGTAKLRFTMAVPKASRDRQDAVDFAFVNLWGDAAEELHSALVEGAWVVMVGSYNKGSYKKSDGSWGEDIHFDAKSVAIIGHTDNVETEVNAEASDSYGDIPF